RLDSNAAEFVLLHLAKKGITALPTHDSFLVKVRHKDELLLAMDAALVSIGAAGAAKGIAFKAAYADGTKETFPSRAYEAISTAVIYDEDSREQIDIPQLLE